MLESKHFCANCRKTRAFESTNWYREALAFFSKQCRLPPPEGKVFRETEEIEGVLNYDWGVPPEGQKGSTRTTFQPENVKIE